MIFENIFIKANVPAGPTKRKNFLKKNRKKINFSNHFCQSKLSVLLKDKLRIILSVFLCFAYEFFLLLNVILQAPKTT